MCENKQINKSASETVPVVLSNCHIPLFEVVRETVKGI